MKIGIITDSLRENSTGIGVYSKSIIKEIIELYKNNTYFLIDYVKTDFNLNKLILIKNPFKFLKTYSWHNYLPFKTRNLDFDYILNLSAVPHYFPFKQKEIFFIYDISWYLYREYHPKRRVLYYKSLLKRTLDNSYKIVTDSYSAKEDLIKYFYIHKDKILVIYPTVPKIDLQKKKMNMDIKNPYLLYIGTLEPRKNIESIIKAFQILKTKNKINYKLILCGKKGWLYKNIFDLIKSTNLESEIKYLGYISEEEKSNLLRNTDCFVYPSNYEGFGIPVIEAISYGAPVITSNISSLPEAVGKAGIQIDPHNINLLEKAMEQVLFNDKKRSEIIRHGKKQLENISNKKQIQELINIINE